MIKLNLTNHYKRSIVHIREYVKKKIHKREYFLKKVMPFNERLESVINKHAKNLSDFALKYGYTKSTLHNYLKGRDLDSKFIISLKDKLNVNPTWLLTGEGGMFLSDAGNGGKPDVNFDKRGNPIVKYPTAEINPILGELTADEIVLIQSHRKMKAEMEKKSKKSS